jgi:3-phosphoshikimate 1-carboxyvinyltransferase
MEDLYRSLESVGATVERREGRSLPVVIRGPIDGHDVAISGSTTSQFVSGLLLAGPLAPRGLEITVVEAMKSSPYVALTVEMMESFGAHVTVEGRRYLVGTGGYKGREVTIEPDASSASYFYAAAAITGGTVGVRGLDRSSRQGDIGFLDLLVAMGASITPSDDGVEVTGTGRLVGIEVDAGDRPDIVPTLAVVAAMASTTTVITGVGFTRGHESDRVGGLVTELRRCGVDARELDDGLVIEPSVPHGALVHTYGDHRMAMAFAILGLVVPGIVLDDAECVAKTFPRFFEVLDHLR